MMYPSAFSGVFFFGAPQFPKKIGKFLLESDKKQFFSLPRIITLSTKSFSVFRLDGPPRRHAFMEGCWISTTRGSILKVTSDFDS